MKILEILEKELVGKYITIRTYKRKSREKIYVTGRVTGIDYSKRLFITMRLMDGMMFKESYDVNENFEYETVRNGKIVEKKGKRC